MKGFRKQTNWDTKRILEERLILKSLPYGKWTTTDNKEYLFNRDYEPIRGRDLTTNTEIPVTLKTWVGGEIETEFYYDGSSYPYRCEKTLRKCWDILATWPSNRREV